MTIKKPKPGKCRGCGADILWVKTASGQKMPLDAEPVWVNVRTEDKGQNTFVRADGSFVFGMLAGDADDDPESVIVEAYESHFATCRFAGDFRKPRKPRDREHRNPFW